MMDIDITYFRIFRAKSDRDGKILATFSVKLPKLGVEIRCWRLCRTPDGGFVVLPPNSLTPGPILSTVVMQQDLPLAGYLVTEAKALYRKALEQELANV